MMMLRLLPSAAARFRRRWELRLAFWLPPVLLLLAISTVYLFRDGWGSFDKSVPMHTNHSAKNMVLAENLSPAHNFLMFLRRYPGPDGALTFDVYNRFPVGGFALIKLVMLPFGDDLSAKLYAARMLMLAMFAGAALLAWRSLCRITGHCWIALAATLWAFSGYYVLYYSDAVSNEMMMDLFGIMLVFHGMTVLVQEGKFGQLLAKTGLALLLGWHVYALLLPFIVLGLSGESIRALRGNRPGDGVIARIRSVAVALIRSRYLRLGAVALMLGLALLSFNLVNEYAALGDETPLRELPSVRSILKRAGQDTEFNADRAEFLAWGTFLSGQFERIGRMSLPYALTVPWGGRGHEPPAGAPSLVYSAVGVAAVGACLLGLLLLRRHRMPLAALALAGLFWGIGMRHNTAIDLHEYESLFYLGIPLALFMLILLGLRRRWRWLPVVAGVGALAIFALSSYQIGRTDAHIAAQARATSATIMSDFQEIRGITRGQSVYVHFYEIGPYVGGRKGVIWYYLAGSVMHLGEKPIAGCGPLCGQYFDFVISSDRNLFPERHLLTPYNREVFLFDTGAIDTEGLTAGYRAVYDAVTSGVYGAPAVQAEYDLFVAGGKAVYYKSGCSVSDMAPKFFLHTIPEDRDDLPEERREHGFDNLDFGFVQRGAVFDGNCIAIAPLPDYPIASIRTGQYVANFSRWREIWSVAISLMSLPDYDAAVSAIAAGGYGEPAGRGVFDVYLGDTEVVYFKEPCDVGDVRARFFLHFVPDDYSDLPPERQGQGFDNRDFSFAERGVVTGGRCLAMAPLPDYPVARVRTGQYVSGEGRIWVVEFAGGR